MEIKGLYEALNISEDQVTELRGMMVDAALQKIMFYSKIVTSGGNIHKVDHVATAKRRAKNKVARESRRNNR